MSIIDYQNRTADILAFHGSFPAQGEQQVTVTLIPDGTGGLLCTGVQKTAQRVLYVLLMKLGSIQYRPDDGTPFLIDAERGAWRTTADVYQSFTAAKLYLMRQLRGAEESTDPEDERVDDVVLTNVNLDLDSVSLTLQLTTLAGDTFTFIAPINVTTR